MKIKVLFGSIGAVVILILVYYANVVSVQSTPTNSVNNSPLFNIRTNRATNTENNRVVISGYLGKGVNILSIPMRDNRTILIQKIIEIIEKMDDKEFNRFRNLILSHFSKEEHMKNIEITNLLTLLRLRSVQKELNVNKIDIIGNKTKYPTYWDSCQFFDCNTIANWFPCLLLFLYLSVYVLVYVFIALIYMILGSLYTINIIY